MRRGEHEAAAPAGKGGPARVLTAEGPARPEQGEQGRPLDAATAGRMGAALGHSFADVRIHDDPAAGEMVRGEQAVATTVGTDIAFASGAYRPGTPMGDALLAHELAHVQQQRGASNTNVVPPSGDSRALEDDAEQATFGALARLHGMPELGGTHGATRTGPRSIQRCGGAPSWAPQMPPGSATATASAPAGILTGEGVDDLLSRSTVVGPYVRGRMNPTGPCASSPRRATGHVSFYEPGEFRDAYTNYLSRRAHPQHTGACGRAYNQTEAQNQPPANAFEDDGQIRINSAQANAATPLHEGIHLFQNDGVFDEVGIGGYEGMTEYLTREVLRELSPGLLAQRAGIYEDEYQAVKAVADNGGGHASICEAYFNADFSLMRAASNDAAHPTRWADWARLMKQVPADAVAARALF